MVGRIYVDTESWIKEQDGKKWHEFRLGVMALVDTNTSKTYKNKMYVFYDKNDFLNIIDKNLRDHSSVYVIAHNWHYDFLNLDVLSQLKEYNFEIVKLVLSGQVFLITAKQGEKKIYFIDSMNYFKTSLEQIAKSINMEKFDVDFMTCSQEDLLKHCRVDVEILMTFFEKFYSEWNSLNAGKFRFTAASLALQLFRTKYSKYNIKMHNDEDIKRLESEGYFGGRNECFWLGKLPKRMYYYLDVNSMYPYVMLSQRYPFKIHKYFNQISVSVLKDLLNKYECIARVKVKTIMPHLPYKFKKLLFPIGSFVTILSGNELRRAILENKVEYVFEAVSYYSDYLFKDFIKDIYQKRLDAKENNNQIKVTLYKLIMNSLYGKYAQREREFRIFDIDLQHEDGLEKVLIDSTKELKNVLWLNGIGYESFVGDYVKKAFPAISCMVTANARDYLWYLMTLAGLNNVYYVDTDSLITNDLGYERLKGRIDNIRLGRLKLEYITEDLIINNVKDYQFGELLKLKGVPKRSVKLSDNAYKYEHFYRLKESLNKGITDRIIVSTVKKELIRKYDKGIVSKDGIVSPYVLNF